MPSTLSDQPEGWYVIRTRPKGEHIAAAHLQQFADIDQVFAPRIRFEKGTVNGKKWFVEALFPGYIFAYFDLNEKLRAVNATTGVTGILRFNEIYPQIEGSFIEELRADFPESGAEALVIEREIEEGDEVLVVDGVMSGMKTVVTKIMSGKERVRILMDWLGEEREAEVNFTSITHTRSVREDF